MLEVRRFVNELMTSNCYVVYDQDAKRCLVIDPGSEKSLHEIDFIGLEGLSLDYIIITHEHTDHNWGVNALRCQFAESRLLCSEECGKNVKKANKAYFLLYYDNPDYRYEIAPADLLVHDGECLEWSNHLVRFVSTPGHSYGSICIEIDGLLFTGDTIMPYKPYFNGRDSNQDDWSASVNRIMKLYDMGTIIYPGHGESMTLGKCVESAFIKVG